jgi:hypothetical protein
MIPLYFEWIFRRSLPGVAPGHPARSIAASASRRRDVKSMQNSGEPVPAGFWTTSKCRNIFTDIMLN